MASEQPLRVVVVEDHDDMRAAFVEALVALGSMDVVGQTGDAGDAVALVVDRQPDVALLDVHLHDGCGIELCRELGRVAPDVRCVLVTSRDRTDARRAAEEAGAHGFVLKTVRMADVIDDIRRAARRPVQDA